MLKRRYNNSQRAPEATTFSQFAASEVDIVGGRFAGQTPQHIVGSTPAPQYPAQPRTPWADDPVEPPLGVSVDEMKPHELLGLPIASPSGDVEAPSGSALTAKASETPSPPSSRRRKRR
jgi:hypothetical protein